MKNTPFSTEAGIMEVVLGFRNLTLPKEQWTHEAHLVTAVWFHLHHTPLEAICYLRSGIISYNEAKGGKNTHTDGYHETLTLFWCNTVHQFVATHRDLPLVELCQAFLTSDQAARDYPMKFYSHERLFSLEARAIWVEPDLISVSGRSLFNKQNS
jgi:hypothetical protein